MESMITSVFSILYPVVWQVEQLLAVKTNVEVLGTVFYSLKISVNQKQLQIITETTNSDEVWPNGEVEYWMKEFRLIEKKVNKIQDEYDHRWTLCCGCPMNCWSSYRISKRAAKLTLKVNALIAKGEKFHTLTRRSAPAIRRMLTIPDTTSSTKEYLSTATTYLEDDEVGMIGIWGMGGVGKTTLLQKLNNHPSVAAAGFDYVIWIVASKDLSRESIQRAIANRVGLNLEDATSKPLDQQLYHFLERKKFLLLLYDIWEPLNLASLGVPYPTSSSINSSSRNIVVPKRKVVFTTRSSALCDEIIARNQRSHVRGMKIKIECMQRKEAWELFLQNVGTDVESIIKFDKRVENRAMQVADKCDGLPLALVVIAQSMSAKKTGHEWEDAVNSLYRTGIQDPFPLLKVSYDMLPSESMKNCFLSLALWPEDYEFGENEIISFWLRMDLIDGCRDVSAAYSKGYSIIQHLKKVCLFEEVRAIYVKLHDSIYGMAQWIITVCEASSKRWMVLKGLTDSATGWREARAISLARRGLVTLPEEFHDCPNLSVMMLQENSLAGGIPEGFFQNMSYLAYLDLSSNRLTDIPRAIGSLFQLQYLNLSFSALSALPVELSNLKKLKHLYLRGTCLKRIPHELISSLYNLELIDLFSTRYDGWGKEGEGSLAEVMQCSSTRALGIDITSLDISEYFSFNSPISVQWLNIEELSRVTTLSLSQSLLQVGNIRHTLRLLRIAKCRSLEKIEINSTCKEEFEILEQLNLFYLDNLVKVSWAGVVQGTHLCYIRILSIENCSKLKDATWILQLKHLESLEVHRCNSMEQLIGDEEDEGTSCEDASEMLELMMSPPIDRGPFSFYKLKYLRLVWLPKLRFVSVRCAVDFPSLKTIDIHDCPKLDVTPFAHLKLNSYLEDEEMVRSL